MIEKIFTFLFIIIALLVMLIFNYHIQLQNKLDMKELEEIVEKELIEKHGKN